MVALGFQGAADVYFLECTMCVCICALTTMHLYSIHTGKIMNVRSTNTWLVRMKTAIHRWGSQKLVTTALR